VALAAADPFQTGTIITVGLLGAALVFALGNLSSQYVKNPNVGGYGHSSGGYGSPCYSYSARSGYGLPGPLIPAGAFRARALPGPFPAGPFPAGPLPAFSARSGCSPYASNAVLVRRRGKRDAKQEEQKVELGIDEVFNKLFGNIHQGRIEGCFQRLVCDMAARPDDFPQNVPILQGVDMMENHALNTEAATVSKLLSEAVHFGRNATDVKECEVVYNDCYWSGQQMDKIISKFDNQVTIEA